MKRMFVVWGLLIALVGLAMGHPVPPPPPVRPHVHWSIVINDPWYAPYYPFRPWYWPAPIVVPVAPVIVEPAPVYIERPAERPLPQPLEPGYWYFCPSKGGYYPDVKTCEEGWLKIPPRQQKQE
ncbi:MAG: hypothetical protein N2441_00500 [Rhodocyclaceae bacterium]|nr:hypothetical protein [Rhodocyclaceae bacterium]